MIPIVSIVGRSGSGKTTLIENIIPRLKLKGYRVGTIKHDAHKFDIDHEGKDTWRMSNSGADTVVISSGDKIAMIKKVEKEIAIDEIVCRQFTDVDIIITEGYKASDKPKIQVVRNTEIITSQHNNLIALVENTPADMVSSLKEADKDGITCFKMKEIDLIVQFIEDKFLNKILTES